MGDLTKNLSRHEFECQCGCGYDTVDIDLPHVIQDVVNHFQDELEDVVVKVHINSGTRCKIHNNKVGGKDANPKTGLDGSQHLYGRAADFYVYYIQRGKKHIVHEDHVADYLERRYPRSMGIGRYKGRTHVDIRKQKARWDAR